MSDHDPTYWERIRELLARIAAPQPLFVDGGANRGDFTATLLDQYPDATVHAVEPNPGLCEALAQRFASRPVHVHEAALYSREGTLELNLHENPGTSSLLPRPASGRRYFHSSDRVVATVPVRATTLDRLAAAESIERIALLKLDTQGAELPIIEGAAGLLGRGAIDVIYTEFFVVPHYEGAALLHELWGALAAHDYVLYDLFKGPYGRNGQLRFGDALFVSPRVRAGCLDTFPEEG
jgi:FkbM family methyltransferase